MKFRLKIFGNKVGQDIFGNQYYLYFGNRRMAIYSGKQESTKAPPEWRAWLHGVSNHIPKNVSVEHEPNCFGWHFDNKESCFHNKRPSYYSSWSK